LPEETESKLPLAAPAISVASPRETAGFFPPPPEKEDWNEHPERETLKRKCFTYIFTPTRTWEERMTFISSSQSYPPMAA
jgi:hypothetical protein